MRRRFITIAILLTYLLAPSSAFAKRKPKPKPNHLVVYAPVSEKSADKQLAAKVTDHAAQILEDKSLYDYEKVISDKKTIDRMVKRYRCDPYEDACLAKIQKKVPGKGILFVRVEPGPKGPLTRITHYNYDQYRYLSDFKNITIDPNGQDLDEAIGLALETAFYGKTGELSVELNGKDHGLARLFIDGLLVPHQGFWTTNDLAFGPHTVKVESPDGTVEEKTVVVRKKAPGNLKFDVKDAPEELRKVEEPPKPPKEFSIEQMLPWELPGYIALGVGAAGLVTGIVGSAFEVQGRNQITEICSRPENSCGESRWGSELANSETAKKFAESYDKASTGITLEVIGYSVAVAGIAAGSYLLYMAFIGDPNEDPSTTEEPQETKETKASVAFGIVPTWNGVAASGILRF